MATVPERRGAGLASATVGAVMDIARDRAACDGVDAALLACN